MMKHAYRIMILLGGAGLLLGWVIKHSEPSSNIGLRDIQQAEQLDRGAWRDGLLGGIDHPLHPLLITAAHHLIGGDTPGSWQRAALVLCFTSGILLVIPIYLLALELFDGETAWLACLLTIANPIVGQIVLNVLSESTFLLWWTFGLWAAIRFLREGRILWLPLAIGCGALAYLTRPEGMLLPLALAATLLILPVSRATRINWPRWSQAMLVLVGGLVFLVGPYVALKGGLGTKPPIAQVLGLAPPAEPLALEREAPLPPGQTMIESYGAATIRVLEIVRDGVTLPLLPFAIVGLVMAARNVARTRAALFLAIVLAASAIGLVRLHVTAGYCTPRHAVVPGMLLTLAAAHAMTAIVRRIAIPGRWLGMANDSLRPGPAVWAVLLALLAVVPNIGNVGPINPGPYAVYHHTGEWIARNVPRGERVLDMTDWSLYLSGRTGYTFADLYTAPADPRMRWIVVRDDQLEGPSPYCQAIRDLIGDRQPIAQLPAVAAPHQMTIAIYDRHTPDAQTADAATVGDGKPWRR
jgi:4-amino-4-deoxy-L-arabinose transferase-like glycosyltransferase